MSTRGFSPEAGRTVVRPMPGGRLVHPRQYADEGAAPPGSAGWPEMASQAAYVSPRTWRNPLLIAANRLLVLAPQIRHSATHPDPQRLKNELTQAVRRFDEELTAAGMARATVVGARYVLCTFVDECAASTPWGSRGIWATDTLLVRLHGEAWGGEKVFQLLNRLAQEPHANADLLELIYVCLALGFEGCYRVRANGRAELDRIRDKLYRLLQAQHGPVERALSEYWRPAAGQQRRWFDLAPLWVFLVFCAVAMASVFLACRFLLNERSDPVFEALQAIRPAPLLAPAPPPVAPPAPAAAPPPRLDRFLAPEIAAGLVSVDDRADRSIVTIRSDALFEPGSAQINDTILPLIGRIGAALRVNPGTVLVDGHTDSQPIHSVRYPSNFHLSQERADGIAALLGKSIERQRLHAQGKADAEPIAPNDTPAGRARNRRVTITLLPTTGAGP